MIISIVSFLDTRAKFNLKGSGIVCEVHPQPPWWRSAHVLARKSPCTRVSEDDPLFGF